MASRPFLVRDIYVLTYGMIDDALGDDFRWVWECQIGQNLGTVNTTFFISAGASRLSFLFYENFLSFILICQSMTDEDKSCLVDLRSADPLIGSSSGNKPAVMPQLHAGLHVSSHKSF